MAVITPTVERIRNAVIVAWTFTEADTCAAFEESNAIDASVQVAGTFGGATALLTGSNDKTNFVTLNDAGGAAISKAAAALVGVREKVRQWKPSASGGTSQSLTVTLRLLKE